MCSNISQQNVRTKPCLGYIGFLARLISNGELDQLRYSVTRLARYYLVPEPHLSIKQNSNNTLKVQNERWALNEFKPENSFAISIHAYYPDIALNEIAPLVNTRLGHQVDIFISVPDNTKSAVIEALRNAFNGRVCIVALSNHGRDILPFLTVLPVLIEHQYKWVCKIHTKRSLHSRHGNRWRHDLYKTLLSDRSIQTIRTMSNEQGLAYPWFSKCSIKNFAYDYREQLEELVLTHACSTDIADSSFIAGSMFWFRPEGLVPLTRISLNQYKNKFELENAQIDGTYAHAMERLFLHIAHDEGFKSCRLT